MYFIPFTAVLPEIGQSETRSLRVPPNLEAPEGFYAFLEFYCIDPKCDCQLVRFMVMGDDDQRQALITYGWKSKLFTMKLFHHATTTFQVRILLF